jgi:hypothetical protein
MRWLKRYIGVYGPNATAKAPVTKAAHRDGTITSWDDYFERFFKLIGVRSFFAGTTESIAKKEPFEPSAYKA